MNKEGPGFFFREVEVEGVEIFFFVLVLFPMSANMVPIKFP
jgi:hypothetical protein